MGNADRPRVVIAGASGLIGGRLRGEFQDRGYEVLTVNRDAPGREPADAHWHDADALRKVVDGADVLVNLAGKSVNCRYNDRNREAILKSRTETTAALRRAVEQAEQPPSVWLNASTATVYRHAMDRPQSEAEGDVGAGFSVDVATNWERELFAGDLPDTRRIAMRISIVLGADAPATDLLFQVARLGLGGPQFDGWWPKHRRYRGIGPRPTGPDDSIGNHTRGRQRFSWIHIDDFVRAVFLLIDTESIAGPVNLASPGVSDNRTLMRALRHVVGMPIGLPAFRWMLEPAMAVLRTEPEMLLKSRWIDSRVLREAGFEFEWTELEPALREIHRTNRSQRRRVTP